VLENLRTFLRWLQSRHAPLGRAAPLCASALFAAAAFSHSAPLKFLAYGLATVLAILIAGDICSGMLEWQGIDNPNSTGHGTKPLRRVSLSPFQFVLVSVQASIYTFFIFSGLGPVAPYALVVPVFALSVIVAWRNIRLWYREGAEYEEDLREWQQRTADKLARASIRNLQHQLPAVKAQVLAPWKREAYQNDGASADDLLTRQ
jgi:hypothetical protein